MNAHAFRSGHRPILAGGVALATALLVAGPAAARASSDVALTVGGASLDGASVAAGSLASVAAPDVIAVRWEVDGSVRGGTGAYAVLLPTSPGKHRLRAEVTTAGGRRESVRARFIVTAPVTVKPPVSPKPVVARTTAPRPSDVTVTVTTASALRGALAAARPGTVIALADGTYTGTFIAAADGTIAAPITLRGSRAAVLTTGGESSGGYALHITGSHWQVQGLSVRTAKKGIVLDGSVGSVIDGVEVSRIGQEGVHFRAGSSDGVVEHSVIHDTGTSSPEYGEGVYVGSAKSNWGTYSGGAPDRSDRVVVADNTIYDTAAEGIDVKEGTTGGTIRGNTFRHAGFSGKNSADSWVDVKGNGWTVTGNSGSVALVDAFQTHVVVSGWGEGNVFSRNTVTSGVPGYAVAVYPQPGAHGNVVGCDDVMRSGGKGVSNIRCS